MRLPQHFISKHSQIKKKQSTKEKNALFNNTYLTF